LVAPGSLELRLDRQLTNPVLENPVSARPHASHRVAVLRNDVRIRTRKPFEPEATETHVELVTLLVQVHVECKAWLSADIHIDVDVEMARVKGHPEAREG
jgi:hypothetical protein